MKNLKNIFSIILLLSFVVCNYSYSAPKFLSKSSKQIAPDPIFKKTVVIPNGITMKIGLSNQQDWSTLKIADKVSAILISDFYYGNKLIAPENSTVTGIVTKLPQNNKYNRPNIKFTTIITPNGQIIPISANIIEESNDYIVLKIMQPITVISQ